MRRHPWVTSAAVLGILALAALLRGLPLGSHGLWLDEFGTLWAAGGADLSESVQRAWNVQGQSPLYYLLVRGWTAIAGESELALRLPSWLAGVAALPLAWDSLRRSAGRRAAAAALLILGANPLLVFMSHQARPYALATLGIVLCHWGLTRALRSGRLSDRLWTWAGAVLAAYATPLCAPVAAAVLIGVGLTPVAQRRYPLRRALLDACFAGVLLVPVVLHAVSLLARRDSLQTWLPHPDLHVFFGLLPGLLVTLALVGLVGLARFLNRSGASARPRPARGVLAFELSAAGLIAGGLLAGLAMGTDLLVGRYLLGYLVAAGLLQARLVGRLPWPLAAIALACVLVAPQARAVRAERSWPEWREALAELDRASPAGEPLIVRTEFIESESLVAPPYRLSPWVEAFLSAPVTARAGLERPVLHLPFHWGVQPTQGEYFEQRLVPTLARCRGFTLAAPPDWIGRFARWAEWRFPGRFVPISRSVLYRTSNNSALVLVRFTAR